MATTWISTNTELGLINALTQSLTVFLLNDAPQGKNLFVKDAAGNSVQSTITLTTQGVDTFEDGSFIQTLNSAYESIQLNYNTNKWYITGGTMFNTMSVSTLQAQTIRATTISTNSITVSTLQFNHNPTSTIGTFNALSNILYYNGNSVGGGLRTAIPQTLNSYRFSLVSLFSYLLLWVDSSDTTTISRTGSTITRITDKSGNNSISINGTLTYTLGAQNGLNVISVTNNGFFFTNERPQLSPLNQVSAFIVLIQSVTPTGLIEFFRAGGGNNFSFFDMFYINGGGLYVNTNGNSLQYATNTTGAVSIYEFVYDGNRRTSYLTGSVLASSTSAGTSLTTAYAILEVLRNITGYFCEAMYFQRALSNIERQQVEGYLAWKWGIQAQLPASHPFRNAPPQ